MCRLAVDQSSEFIVTYPRGTLAVTLQQRAVVCGERHYAGDGLDTSLDNFGRDCEV